LSTFKCARYRGAYTSIKSYSGEGDGGQAKSALDKFFIKLALTDTRYQSLLDDLNTYASSLNKKINAQIENKTGGGIFLPKEKFLNIESTYSQELFDQAQEDIEQFQNEENYTNFEGCQKSRLINFYERDPKLRSEAIKIHGIQCLVCGFDFKKHYGVHGENYIEVHHLKPLSKLVEKTLINPITDMTVVCANCHRMMHRKRETLFTINDLKKIWRK